MREKPIGQAFLESLKSFTILAISVYASLLTIVSVNDQVKPFLALPENVKAMEDKLQNSIVRLESKQKEISQLVKLINNNSSIGHAKIFDTEGYRDIKIRVANKEKNEIDQNSIYYDSRSNFFPQLAKGRNIRHYQILLKNDDNLFSPKILVKIRGRTNHDGSKKSKQKSEICFQVSKSIYTTLGGKKNKTYLEVKAKVIP